MTKRTPNKTRPRIRTKKKSPATSAQKSDAAERPGGKLGLILDRLGRKTGATIDELVDATGWQKHSVHGALTLPPADRGQQRWARAVKPDRQQVWGSLERHRKALRSPENRVGFRPATRISFDPKDGGHDPRERWSSGECRG